ncbi:MAG: NAD(P)H-dependent glycerol-3-phosphate dehydrogenase, partial [Gammaproteobacteria bacterium]
MSEVTVAGGGNFGTAIANIIADNGHTVNLWMRDRRQVEDVRSHRENRRYLPGHPLNERVVPTDDLAGCVARSDVVFVTVPSASFREVALELKPHVDDAQHCLVSATKGIEASTFKLMSDILAEECPAAAIGAISGPNLAEEIADQHYTATVIASHDEALCERVQALLGSSYFRVYASADVYGVELGGALKNIYAIACGMASALGVGQNTIALLITRSL